MKQVGLVAIGGNEGQRLRQCLVSATDQVSRVVYVDSGSTDGSLELARSIGSLGSVVQTVFYSTEFWQSNRPNPDSQESHNSQPNQN